MVKASPRQQEELRQARKQNRAGLSLKDKVLSPGLHQRYALAASRILNFWQDSNLTPCLWEKIDLAASQCLEYVFAEGYPKGYGSDGLAALQHFLPEAAGKLRHSWRLLKSWQKMEPPVRVLPISPLMVLAISGACVRLGRIPEAAAFLVAFDALLRPGELYSLTAGDVTWARGRAVLSLRNTKSGLRKGATEMVVCQSHVTNVWLWAALRHKKATDKLLPIAPADLRHVFHTMIQHLNVPGHFSLYSFRRGGATWHFISEQSMEATLLRGRWVSTSTARIYLQDAAATLSHLQISDTQKAYMHELASVLSANGQRGVRG